ncbi:hypothetical protein J6590_003333 [Homalodisca vitripennis]|nr:hypothetical protein J6590_003333 [Homalodisca vitripennis]
MSSTSSEGDAGLTETPNQMRTRVNSSQFPKKKNSGGVGVCNYSQQYNYLPHRPFPKPVHCHCQITEDIHQTLKDRGNIAFIPHNNCTDPYCSWPHFLMRKAD